VQTRIYGDDSFIVVTAAEKPHIFDIRHAYLFFETDPIVIKYGMDVQQKRSLVDFVQTAPLDQAFKRRLRAPRDRQSGQSGGKPPG